MAGTVVRVARPSGPLVLGTAVRSTGSEWEGGTGETWLELSLLERASARICTL